jgi:hypothetical protein
MTFRSTRCVIGVWGRDRKRSGREDLGRYREIEEDARKIRMMLHRDMGEIRDPEEMQSGTEWKI